MQWRKYAWISETRVSLSLSRKSVPRGGHQTVAKISHIFLFAQILRDSHIYSSNISSLLLFSILHLLPLLILLLPLCRLLLLLPILLLPLRLLFSLHLLTLSLPNLLLFPLLLFPLFLFPLISASFSPFCVLPLFFFTCSFLLSFSSSVLSFVNEAALLFAWMTINSSLINLRSLLDWQQGYHPRASLVPVSSVPLFLLHWSLRVAVGLISERAIQFPPQSRVQGASPMDAGKSGVVRWREGEGVDDPLRFLFTVFLEGSYESRWKAIQQKCKVLDKWNVTFALSSIQSWCSTAERSRFRNFKRSSKTKERACYSEEAW